MVLKEITYDSKLTPVFSLMQRHSTLSAQSEERNYSGSLSHRIQITAHKSLHNLQRKGYFTKDNEFRVRWKWFYIQYAWCFASTSGRLWRVPERYHGHKAKAKTRIYSSQSARRTKEIQIELHSFLHGPEGRYQKRARFQSFGKFMLCWSWLTHHLLSTRAFLT